MKTIQFDCFLLLLKHDQDEFVCFPLKFYLSHQCVLCFVSMRQINVEYSLYLCMFTHRNHRDHFHAAYPTPPDAGEIGTKDLDRRRTRNHVTVG